MSGSALFTIVVGGGWSPGNLEPYCFGMFGGMLLVGQDVHALRDAAQAGGIAASVTADGELTLTFGPEQVVAVQTRVP